MIRKDESINEAKITRIHEEIAKKDVLMQK